MSFSDLRFLFWFLPPFVLAHTLVPPKARNALLLAGSLGLYLWGAGWFAAALLALFITFNWALALALGRATGSRARRGLLALGLGMDLGLLVCFKYAVQFGASIALPLGISFYVFQAAAYLFDCYRGVFAPERDIVDFGAFLTAYPQLVMGPILRYAPARRAFKRRTVCRADLEQGFQLFVVGLALKVILADQLASLWASLERIGYAYLSTPLAWLGAVGYSLQLYLDFQGYSLMAVGLGRMLALPVPHNFDDPYLSRSVSEFYRRWHVTLGTWFRDYVYIPLGGSRNGDGRTALSLGAVWLLTGIWHGTSVNFLLWAGALFGFILLEKFALRPFLERHNALSRIYTLFVIVQTWVLFRITNLGQLGAYFSRLYPFFGGGGDTFGGDFARHLASYWWLIALGILFCLPYPRRFYEKYKQTPLVWAPLLIVFWGCVYLLATGSGGAFLYFRF